MRNAINNNPKVQAGLIVGLLLVGVLMFMKMSSKPSTSAQDNIPTSSADPAATGTAATGTATSTAATGSGATGAGAATTSAPAAAGTVATAIPSAPAAAATVSPQALIPGPGLPADVAQAFARGNAVVLLIVKEGATDDDLVRGSVDQISQSGVSVFVAPASRIARYSRITQGAGVNRVPALIVIRPRRLSGDTPQAIVSYGFRNRQSVVQAVDDALYQGRDDVPYHPG